MPHFPISSYVLKDLGLKTVQVYLLTHYFMLFRQNFYDEAIRCVLTTECSDCMKKILIIGLIN